MLLCLLFVPSDPYTDIYVYFFLQNLRKLKFCQKKQEANNKGALGLVGVFRGCSGKRGFEDTKAVVHKAIEAKSI